MNITEIFLPYGNVTVAVLILIVTALTLSALLQLGIWLFKDAIKADDENAPDFKFENKLWKGIVKVWGWLYVPAVEYYSEDSLSFIESKIIKEEYEGVKGYRVKSRHLSVWSYVAEDGIDTSSINCRENSFYKSKDKAIEVCAKYYDIKKKYTLIVNNLWKTATAILLTDFTIFMLGVNFTLTIVILAILGVRFTTRFIAKNLYKLMKKTKKNTDDIGDIKESLK